MSGGLPLRYASVTGRTAHFILAVPLHSFILVLISRPSRVTTGGKPPSHSDGLCRCVVYSGLRAVISCSCKGIDMGAAFRLGGMRYPSAVLLGGLRYFDLRIPRSRFHLSWLSSRSPLISFIVQSLVRHDYWCLLLLVFSLYFANGG